MNKIAFFALLICCTPAAFAKTVINTVNVTPEPFFLTVQAPTHIGYAFVVNNPGTTPQQVDVSTRKVFPGIKNALFQVDRSLPGKAKINLDLSPYVHYYPMHFVLPPHQFEVVGMYLDLPNTLLPATYYQNIQFASSAPKMKTSSKKTKKQSAGIVLSYNVQSITSVYISNGTANYSPITVECHIMPNGAMRLNIHNPTAYVFSPYYQVSIAGQPGVVLDNNPGSVLPYSDAIRNMTLPATVSAKTITTQQTQLTWAMHYETKPIHTMINCIYTPLPKVKATKLSKVKKPLKNTIHNQVKSGS